MAEHEGDAGLDIDAGAEWPGDQKKVPNW